MDSESQTPVSYPSLIVTVCLSGLVLEVWAWDRQTIRYDTIEEFNVDSKAEYTA